MQVKKEETYRKILDSAIRLFVETGVSKTTISKIAKNANISTGNVYRYFSDKDALLRVVVPIEAGTAFKKSLKHLIWLSSGTDMHSPGTLYVNHLNELVTYTIENRKVLLVLLSEESGQFFSEFRSDICELLVTSAQEYFSIVYPEKRLDGQKKLLLRILYKSFVDSAVELLKRHSSPSEIKSGIVLLRAYHLNGMRSFFEV